MLRLDDWMQTTDEMNINPLEDRGDYLLRRSRTQAALVVVALCGASQLVGRQRPIRWRQYGRDFVKVLGSMPGDVAVCYVKPRRWSWRPSDEIYVWDVIYQAVQALQPPRSPLAVPISIPVSLWGFSAGANMAAIILREMQRPVTSGVLHSGSYPERWDELPAVEAWQGRVSVVCGREEPHRAVRLSQQRAAAMFATDVIWVDDLGHDWARSMNAELVEKCR